MRDDLGERLGRLVRETWVAWAKEQPSPKPSWLTPWEDLSEPEREVDRRIGLAVYGLVREKGDALAKVTRQASVALKRGFDPHETKVGFAEIRGEEWTAFADAINAALAAWEEAIR